MIGISLTPVPANPAESDQIQPARLAGRPKSNQVAPKNDCSSSQSEWFRVIPSR
jgi:hypothetical protein